MSSDAERTCAYCGEDVLTGSERPEHPLPAAIGASLTVRTVCEPCNRWAGRAIDQPWLREDLLLASRATHAVPDPRRAVQRAARHPFLRGHTDDGVRVETDAQLRPRLHGRIIEDGEHVQIVAGSDAEADRLLERVQRKAAADGKAAKIVERRTDRVRPWVTARISLDAGVWARFAAKLALGVGSVLYPAMWRRSADACTLREQMRDPNGDTPGLVPHFVRSEDPLRSLAPPGHHLLSFEAVVDGRAALLAMIFGELMFGQLIDTSGAPPPRDAWLLDPQRPRADGRMTWDDVLLGAVRRMGTS